MEVYQMVDDKVSQSGRIFLVDHMCVLPYGHNLNALILFERAFRSYFRSPICLATRDLSDEAEEAALVDRILSYPYDGLIGTTKKGRSKQVDKTAQSGASYLSLLKLVAHRAFYTGLNVFLRYDYVRARTVRDWRKVFRRYEIGPEDVIFFPSAEYYGCLSLLDLVRKLPPEQRPKIHFRMIGVMESANYTLESARPDFFAEIRRALADQIQLSISAETPPYCELIERMIGAPVIYMPYPLANDQEPLAWKDIKVVSSPGQGRADKGFLRLYAIISGLLKTGALEKFSFDVQNMRRTDNHFRARYESTLKHVPNLRLRPARMSQAEIDEAYRKSDILVLPYDSDTYAFRGSAVYQEGLAIGRPVVCSKGLGFSGLVTKYGNGLLASSDLEFSDKIIELAAWPKDVVEQRMTAARELYQKDFDQGLRNILESIGNDCA
jgi:glycosyltransferase involved in cell wall biosynthesis